MTIRLARHGARSRLSEALAYLRLLYPVRAGVRFLIFAQGRTGTWLLHDLLNAHPRICCEKEILMARRFAPYAFLEARSHRRSSVYGCHVQIRQLLDTHQLDPFIFLRSMHRSGWRIVYVRRENILRQSVSSMIAKHRKIWRTTRSEDMPRQRVNIDLNELMAWLDRRQAFLAQEAAALRSLPHLSLVYEDDLLVEASHQATMDRVFAFLGVEPTPVRASLKRLGGDSLADSIENFPALVDRVTASPYSRYLE